MEQTKENFSKFIIGEKSTPSSQVATNVAKFKIPKIRNEEEAQATARAGKRNLSNSDSGRDSSLTPINKIKWGDTFQEDVSHSEDGCNRRCPGVSDSLPGKGNL